MYPFNKNIIILKQADGEFILAGGNTKYINIYDVQNRILVKKYLLTSSRSYKGTLDKYSTRDIKDGINMKEIDDSDDSEYDERKDQILPGSKKPTNMKRNAKLKIECRSVKFSPNGSCWACASSEGLHIYSGSQTQYFTPYELDENISI